MNEKELKIQKIKNGTVIDHLPAGTALSVVKILGVDREYGNAVSIAMNVESKSSSMKDIVKVEDKILETAETDKLALIAPNATINIIKDYNVVRKNKVILPDEIKNIIKCGNPDCVTNQNEPITPVFSVESRNPVRLRCKFCERIMERDLIEKQF